MKSKHLFLIPILIFLVALSCGSTIIHQSGIVPGSGLIGATYTTSTNKTAEAVIELPIVLYQPALAETTVTITPGGNAQGADEDYGFGKKYTLSATTCTILAGTTTPTVPVTVTIFNNPIIDLDKVALFSFSNNNGYAFAYATANITIVDDARSGIIDVPAPSGGEDTAAIQTVINRAHAAGAPDTDNYVIRFQPGTYLVDNVFAGCVYLYPGNTYTAENLGSTVIKRIGAPSAHGVGERLFTSMTGSIRHNDRFLAISNLAFDGNDNRIDEQSALIFIGAQSDAGERLQFAIQNCLFRSNPIADGIHIWSNANAKIYNCDSYGIMRGSWTLTGGNTAVNIKKFITHDGDNDIEVDSSAYGGSYGLQLIAEDCPIAHLNDVGIGKSDESVLSFNRCNSAALFNYQWKIGSVIEFNSCNFAMHNDTNNRLLNPYDVTFNDCNFTRTYGGTDDLYPCCFPLVYTKWNPDAIGETLTLNNCTLKTDGSIPANVPVGGLKHHQGPGDDYSNQNKLIFNSCTFGDASTKDLNFAVMSTSTTFLSGGWIEFHDCIFNIDDKYFNWVTYYPIHVTGKQGGPYFYLALDNITFNTNKFLAIRGNYSGNVIKIQNVSITKAQNVISGEYYNITFDGDATILRVITGTDAPGSTPGFRNADGTKYDQYHDTASGKYYKCTAMNPVEWTEYTP